MDQQGLGQAGHAHQQAVASGKEADERLLDDGILADNHLAQFGGNPAAGLVQALGERGIVQLVQPHRGRSGSHAVPFSQRVSA